MAADFIYEVHGSIVVLTPVTQDAENWIDANLPEETPSWGKGVAIEINYSAAVFHGIAEDGLMLQRYA